MRSVLLSLSIILTLTQTTAAQKKRINPVQFFADTAVIQTTLVLPLKTILRRSNKDKEIPGRFIAILPDGRKVNDPVRVAPRGNFRKENCYLPPLKIKFVKSDSSYLSSLKTLKLVNTCGGGNNSNEYLLKEYLVYKIYNLFTDMSFKVRLLNMLYEDSDDRKKPMQYHAFLIEDTDEMARRNNYQELKGTRLNTENTDRKEMTLLALFQYMIGNTDWAVPVTHNIKLIVATNSINSSPVAVPYDFDYCGLVNPHYAIPDPLLGIEKVTERIYRGFPRTMEELNAAIKVFNEKRDTMYALIDNFELLPIKERQNMTYYLDGFYKTINNKALVEFYFINKAKNR